LKIATSNAKSLGMLTQEIFENKDVKWCTLTKFRDQISNGLQMVPSGSI